MHERVDLELGLLVHQAAGRCQALVDALPHPGIQTDLQNTTCLDHLRKHYKMDSSSFGTNKFCTNVLGFSISNPKSFSSVSVMSLFNPCLGINVYSVHQ